MEFAVFLLVLISFDFSKKQIALTFDDGPCSNGDDLLDALKAVDVKATFFLIGNNVANNEAQIVRAVAEGHEIGCHSWGYDSDPTESEITKGQQALATAGGGTCTLFRAPNLAYSTALSNSCKNLGLSLIGSNLVGEDWDQGANTLTTAQVVAKIVSGPYDGAIALLHWPNTAPQTVAAVADIVNALKADYDFLTISELALAKGVTLQAGQQYDSIIKCEGLTPSSCGSLVHCETVANNCYTKICTGLASCPLCLREKTCGEKTGCVWNETSTSCVDAPPPDTDGSRLSTPSRLLVMAIASMIAVFLAGLFA